MSSKRISFEEAVSEKKLLKGYFQQLALPQQVALKALYGAPLNKRRVDDRGWNELEYWSAMQGEGEYDELGYLTRVKQLIPYTPQTYTEGWAVMGRRAGKTDKFASTIVAYEATCGGHEDYIRKGQTALCFEIAQDLRMARYSLNFIRATIEESPILAKMVRNITADRIDLSNGLTIATVPPTLKSVRGFANPVAVLDEVGVWYQDSDAANPDYEIWRAVKPGQTQFEFPLVVGISSPWNKAGLLYQYFEAGTNGCRLPESEQDRFKNCLVLYGTSAGMGNPRVTQEWLRSELQRDPRAFEREYLAVFQDSLSGFLSPTLLKEAVMKGVRELPPEPRNVYVAAIDPAFRRDAFGFTIVHHGPEGLVQDVARRWVAPTPNTPLNPILILDELLPLLRKYNVALVYSDQYHMESLQQLAILKGFAIEGVVFTGGNKAGIFGNLQHLVNTKKIKLLDHPETLRELRSLERVLTPGGNVQIAAPAGQYDDMAAVLAIACHKATWLMPHAPKEEPREKTIFERIQEQVRRKRGEQNLGNWD